MTSPQPFQDKFKDNKDFYKKIWVLDGAYGTRFQAKGLSEADYRTKELKNHPVSLKGNHDLLNLSRPDVVEEIHTSYIAAGAQIIKTNTFNANAISQADYDLAALAPKIACEGARIARRAADKAGALGLASGPVLVAGDIGPTNKTLSLSPDVSRPGFRATSFRILAQTYFDQIAALDEGGVDLILIETIFDTLNAKAAAYAYERYYAEKDASARKPLWFSVTITDRSGRTLSGQTLEAFYTSIEHCQPAIVGINCALGAQAMLPYVRDLSRYASCAISCHPNAGLPNELGAYDETPAQMADTLKRMAEEGLVNIVGACCGSTPEHIAAIASAVKGITPRQPFTAENSLRLSGLEPFNLPANNAPFVFIGERTNVTGSPKFAAAVRAGDMSAALKIAADQVRNGANIIDINFDEALLDSPALMREFVNLVSSEPEIARVPLMLDSSRMEVIEAGLQCAQGKCIVNSISLKDGEAKFLSNAELLRRYGAAAIVMAFDERGQAADISRRLEICQRSYHLLTSHGFPACDIIFDLNILTIGTGLAEHAAYAQDFIEAIPQVKKLCPGVRVSGGLSNLSFAFRGQNTIREAMHAVFLYHAIKAGLDMAIVNAGMIRPYDELPAELRQICEDLVFNRAASSVENLTETQNENPTEKLLAYAQAHAADAKNNLSSSSKKDELSWRALPLAERMSYALMRGVGDFVTADAHEALSVYKSPLEIIEGPLMDGMRKVGDLFGEGKMFLPQVIKTARVMKEFVAVLQPYLQSRDGALPKKAGKILLATVKGDVHDIGKNIVGIVLSCNNYEVIDLGVMIPFEKIIAGIRAHQPDIVGFSGLITPSLQEMIENVAQLRKEGVKLPILIGGATTSRLHTALKIDPEFFPDCPVVHVIDASRAAEVCQKLLSPEFKAAYLAELKASYAELRASHALNVSPKLLGLAEARQKHPEVSLSPHVAVSFGVKRFDSVTLSTLVDFIDWSPFFWAWGLKGVYPKILENPEAAKLFTDAQLILKKLIASKRIQPRGVIGLWPAWREGDSICVKNTQGDLAYFHFLRQQRAGEAACQSLADFIAPAGLGEDSIGGFVVSATDTIDQIAKEYSSAGDDYSAIIVKALGDRIAEAFAEYAHIQVRRLWGQGSSADNNISDLLAEKYPGIRPAFGYPACPDHSEKSLLWQLLEAEASTGARLTESFAMFPASTVSGLYFHHPQARYFSLGKIGQDQLADYAARKGWTLDQARRWLAGVL